MANFEDEFEFFAPFCCSSAFLRLLALILECKKKLNYKAQQQTKPKQLRHDFPQKKNEIKIVETCAA